MGGYNRPGSFVLFWPGDIFFQGGGGCQREIGIAQAFAGDEDKVGVAGSKDVLCLLRGGDESYGAGGYSGCLFDLRGKWHLIAWVRGDLCACNIAAGRSIYEVYSPLFQ